MLQKIEATKTYIENQTGFKGKIAVVLGSGLGSFTDKMNIEFRLAYQDIPHFPVSTVEGHTGELVFGTLEGKSIVAMKGRFHYYEGYSMEELTFPIRIFQALGVEYLLVSNAAGGINFSFEVGDIMMITDQINFFGTNPLIGKNYDELGPRFPDMSQAFNHKLCDMARAIAQSNRIKMQEGVYVGGTGPSFETPAEYRFFQTIGGDAIGMSTVPEVIVANHAGMKVFGMSVITNNGLAIAEEGNKHTEVLDVAAVATPKLETIFANLVKQL